VNKINFSLRWKSESNLIRIFGAVKNGPHLIRASNSSPCSVPNKFQSIYFHLINFFLPTVNFLLSVQPQTNFIKTKKKKTHKTPRKLVQVMHPCGFAIRHLSRGHLRPCTWAAANLARTKITRGT
jgi:hypothetical protein